MASIDEQIKSNNAQMLKNNDEIARLTAEISTLTSIANDINVSGKGQNKKEQAAAQVRKDGIMANVEADKTKIPVLQSMNAQLTADNAKLIKQRDSEAEAIVNLSRIGKTTASVDKEASANAEATVKIAESKAKAEIATAKTMADVTAQNSTAGNKTKTMIIVSIVAIILIIATVVIVKKLKKGKK